MIDALRLGTYVKKLRKLPDHLRIPTRLKMDLKTNTIFENNFKYSVKIRAWIDTINIPYIDKNMEGARKCMWAKRGIILKPDIKSTVI
jgi:hypothetical protein